MKTICTIIISVILGMSSPSFGQSGGGEAAAEETPPVEEQNAAPAEQAVPPTAPEPYDYKDPGLFARVANEKGIPFPDSYDFRGCLPINDNDPCLPTGYIQAIEEGEPWVSIWKAELVIQAQDDVAAETRLKVLDHRYPNNYKIKWLMAKNLFFRSERMAEDARDEKAVILSEGVDWAQQCLDLEPQDVNCLLHYGTLVGRSATNAGIFRTLNKGKVVEKSWLSAVATKQHYRFPSGNTSVGAGHYGLGIFYRLAPDSWWLNFFFGVRGNIDKSIKYLERALGTKTNQVELYTELAAANYCKYDRDDSAGAKEAADRWVGVCLKLKPNDRVNQISQKDCEKLQQDTDMGCGYSRDGQQETDIEKAKKNNPKKG